MHLLLIIFFSISPLQLALGHPFAQGNVFIVFHPLSGYYTSEKNTEMANAANLEQSLWCQAAENFTNRLPIKVAIFVRTMPKPEIVFPANRYNRKSDRAFLDLFPISASSIGKYRCVITTEDDVNVAGNLFVFMRPILISKIRLEQENANDLFAWIGPPVEVHKGDDAILTCPAVGYPLPRIRWFKDGESLEEIYGQFTAFKYHLIGQSLHILRVNPADEANYKCIATNKFLLHMAGKYNRYQVTLEQKLQITERHLGQ